MSCGARQHILININIKHLVASLEVPMQPLQPCSFCGAEYPDHARFCGKCGHPFKTPIPSQESMLPITILRAKPLAEVPPMPENTPEQTLSPSSARCLEDDQAEGKRAHIAEERFLIVKHLLALLPFVDEEHQAANKKLFETLILTSPPITEPSWERITLIAGVYGRNMYKLLLDKEQKQGLWKALVWALWYEHFFRPKKVKDRLHDLLVFLKGCSWDSEFLASTVSDIEQIILLLDVNPLKKLQDALSNLSSSALPDFNQLCEEIEARISLYLTLPPIDQLSPLSSNPSEADPEITQMIAAIEQHRSLLDKKSESHNQNLLKQACHESSQPLVFLGEDRRAILLENIRHSRLDQVADFLPRIRQPLLSALSQTLFDPAFEEFLPPRHGLHISSKNDSDLFSQAKTWITGSQREEWQKALHIFEQAEQEKTRRDDALLAREWVHFAQAHVSGPINVIPGWEENRCRGMASWEEIWNLAVFYVRVKRTSQALEVLASSVKALTAPFSHLRFALYCGTQILEHATKYSAEIIEQAAAFLREYLAILPLPECYLACFLLLQEKQQKPDTLAQLHLLSTLQALLDTPITLMQPEETLSDNKVEAFKKDLLRLKLTDLWHLWIHDYAQRHPFTAKAWQAF